MVRAIQDGEAGEAGRECICSDERFEMEVVVFIRGGERFGEVKGGE